MEASTSRPFVFLPLAKSARLIIIMPTIQMTNTKPIRSRNGISYNPLSAFLNENPVLAKDDKSANFGKNLKNTENKNPPIVANIAAFEDAFFQKKPKINIAKIPGDTKPVYSCI